MSELSITLIEPKNFVRRHPILTPIVSIIVGALIVTLVMNYLYNKRFEDLVIEVQESHVAFTIDPNDGSSDIQLTDIQASCEKMRG